MPSSTPTAAKRMTGPSLCANAAAGAPSAAPSKQACAERFICLVDICSASGLPWRNEPRADRRAKPPLDPSRAGNADGRPAAPLLDADRRRKRVRPQSRQGGPLDGRRSRPLPRPGRHLRPRRPALPAPPRRSLVRLRRRVRHPVQLSRLALRRDRPLHRAAVRRHRESRGALPRQGAHQRVSGRSESRPLWAYLGPQPAPLVPNCEPFMWKNGFVQIVFSTIPCNWLQCQENSIDPVHFEWMHRNWTRAAERRNGTVRQEARRVGVRRIRVRLHLPAPDRRHGRDRTSAGTVGRICLWPNGLGPAATSSGACRSTTRTRSASPGTSAACRTNANPTCRRAIPTWHGPIDDPLHRPLDHEPRR